MSETRFAPVDAPERKAATEPPKRWRNLYRLTSKRIWFVHFTLTIDFPDSVWTEGEHWGQTLFPCKDTAVTKARELIEGLGWPGRFLLKHLGAFPVDDAP